MLKIKKFLISLPLLGGRGSPYFGLHTHMKDRLDKSHSASAVARQTREICMEIARFYYKTVRRIHSFDSPMQLCLNNGKRPKKPCFECLQLQLSSPSGCITDSMVCSLPFLQSHGNLNTTEFFHLKKLFE